MQDLFLQFFYFFFQIGLVDSPLLLQPINKGRMSNNIRRTAKFLLSPCDASVVDEGFVQATLPCRGKIGYQPVKTPSLGL